MQSLLLMLLLFLQRHPELVEPPYHWAYVETTAYADCPECCPDQTHITADGKHIGGRYVRGIAADKRAIPYHTRVWIPGYGATEVDDTGAAMRNDWRDHHRIHIDLRMRNYEAAMEYGVRYVWIKIYE